MTDQTVNPPRRGFLGRLLRGTALLIAGAGIGAGGFAAACSTPVAVCRPQRKCCA